MVMFLLNCVHDFGFAAVRDSDYQHMRCFAHVLNLSVQKGVNHLPLSDVRRVATYFKRSTVGNRILKVTLIMSLSFCHGSM